MEQRWGNPSKYVSPRLNSFFFLRKDVLPLTTTPYTHTHTSFQGPCLSECLVLWVLQGNRVEHRKRARLLDPRDRGKAQVGDGQPQRRNWTEGQTLEYSRSDEERGCET